jgi:flagellar biosynthesis/type III secretory pathway chaperone
MTKLQFKAIQSFLKKKEVLLLKLDTLSRRHAMSQAIKTNNLDLKDKTQRFSSLKVTVMIVFLLSLVLFLASFNLKNSLIHQRNIKQLRLSAEHVSRIGFALLASTANHQSAIKT